MHKWGWKLALKKHRNLAVAAVARKHCNLGLMTKQLQLKLSVIAGILGKETLKDMGFEKRDFILKRKRIPARDYAESVHMYVAAGRTGCHPSSDATGCKAERTPI